MALLEPVSGGRSCRRATQHRMGCTHAEALQAQLLASKAPGPKGSGTAAVLTQAAHVEQPFQRSFCTSMMCRQGAASRSGHCVMLKGIMLKDAPVAHQLCVHVPTRPAGARVLDGTSTHSPHVWLRRAVLEAGFSCPSLATGLPGACSRCAWQQGYRH